VYDITRASSLREAENLYKLAIQLKDNAKVPFVLVGNKRQVINFIFVCVCELRLRKLTPFDIKL